MSIASRVSSLFSDRSFELAQPLKTVPDPLTQKTTPEIIRIRPDYLEQVYLESPIVFNTINKVVQIIMSTEYQLSGDSKSVEFFNNFLSNIGYRGGENDWFLLLSKIFRYQVMYGYSPVENIFDKAHKEIVDLDIIDPKKFDYAKNNLYKIALDNFGNPLGYIQILPSFVRVENKVTPPPGVTLQANEIFLPPENVAHFKLYETGDGFYGIGLIEPIYHTFIKQKACEEGFANASHRVGYPLLDVAAGDERHEPTEDQLSKIADELKDVNSRNAFVHPGWVKPNILEAKHPERLRTYLDYWVEMMISGMGIAKAFATGSGEATNRATLARQEYIMKLTLKDIIKRTTSTIESKIFKRIVEYHNKSNPKDKINIVKITWGEIALEELDSKASRLKNYGNAGLLRWSPGIEKYIRQIEKLPEDVQSTG